MPQSSSLDTRKTSAYHSILENHLSNKSSESKNFVIIDEFRQQTLWYRRQMFQQKQQNSISRINQYNASSVSYDLQQVNSKHEAGQSIILNPREPQYQSQFSADVRSRIPPPLSGSENQQLQIQQDDLPKQLMDIRYMNSNNKIGSSYKQNYYNQATNNLDDFTGRKYFNYDEIDLREQKSKSFVLNRSIQKSKKELIREINNQAMEPWNDDMNDEYLHIFSRDAENQLQKKKDLKIITKNIEQLNKQIEKQNQNQNQKQEHEIISNNLSKVNTVVVSSSLQYEIDDTQLNTYDGTQQHNSVKKQAVSAPKLQSINQSLTQQQLKHKVIKPAIIQIQTSSPRKTRVFEEIKQNYYPTLEEVMKQGKESTGRSKIRRTLTTTTSPQKLYRNYNHQQTLNKSPSVEPQFEVQPYKEASLQFGQKHIRNIVEQLSLNASQSSLVNKLKSRSSSMNENIQEIMQNKLKTYKNKRKVLKKGKSLVSNEHLQSKHSITIQAKNRAILNDIQSKYQDISLTPQRGDQDLKNQLGNKSQRSLSTENLNKSKLNYSKIRRQQYQDIIKQSQKYLPEYDSQKSQQLLNIGNYYEKVQENKSLYQHSLQDIGPLRNLIKNKISHIIDLSKIPNHQTLDITQYLKSINVKSGNTIDPNSQQHSQDQEKKNKFKINNKVPVIQQSQGKIDIQTLEQIQKTDTLFAKSIYLSKQYRMKFGGGQNKLSQDGGAGNENEIESSKQSRKLRNASILQPSHSLSTSLPQLSNAYKNQSRLSTKYI
ncbi:UNKNOWN [Stylonychia lemnae]|uniref:Uncharacterized protein n=1 Tax=Stylonychia lemnae TaxID=5949 RepID=A0A078AXH2_STYLE|nr:UNKNOWN [Stylonychia lemnae]|eukprot:CDW86864.1 UNKNOWN [Stylonychia lemnae]